MDSNDLETEERNNNSFKKHFSSLWRCKRCIIDTRGHADFGGEVERVLKMVEQRFVG